MYWTSRAVSAQPESQSQIHENNETTITTHIIIIIIIIVIIIMTYITISCNVLPMFGNMFPLLWYKAQLHHSYCDMRSNPKKQTVSDMANFWWIGPSSIHHLRHLRDFQFTKVLVFQVSTRNMGDTDMGVSIHGIPQNGWFIIGNPSINGWFGGTPISGNPQRCIVGIWTLLDPCGFWSEEHNSKACKPTVAVAAAYPHHFQVPSPWGISFLFLLG